MPDPAPRTAHTAAAALAIVVLATGFTACAPRIASLEPEAALPPWPEAPFPGSVAVEPLLVRDGGYLEGDADRLQESFAVGGLSESLRRNRIFARVDSGYATEFESDLVIRGEVLLSWDPRASANFATWFPGGLVLAPNWYGTRQAYAAEARVDLFVRATGKHLGSYEVRTDYELVHRSGSPGPFFGAAIIVPNVMRGVRLAKPRSRYKQLMYPAAHTRLWDELAAQIASDPRTVYAAAEKAQRARCGARLDRPATIGQPWSKFVACQTADFVPTAETKTRDKASSLFVDAANGIQVTVADDRIIRLEQIRPTPP
jgi:hypothetical protein